MRTQNPGLADAAQQNAREVPVAEPGAYRPAFVENAAIVLGALCGLIVYADRMGGVL